MKRKKYDEKAHNEANKSNRIREIHSTAAKKHKKHII